MTFKNRFLPYLLSLGIITSCSFFTPPDSILLDSKCELPCWNDLVPGISNEPLLLEILATLPDINSQSIRIDNQTFGIYDHIIAFSFVEHWSINQRPRLRGNAYIKDGIVSALEFCGEINTIMSDLVKVVEEPSYIVSGNNYGGGRTVILVYPQLGVSYSFTAKLSELEINPSTNIKCIRMFDISMFDKMMEVGFFSNGFYNAEETRRVWYPWNGYGNLDEKYPPRLP